MGGHHPGDDVLDEALLRTVARRLGGLTLVETVSVFPREKPASVVATFDGRYYPERISSVTLEHRAYIDGRFYVTYREDWEDRDWLCRWDRHDNPHSSRDHFHAPPDARAEDAVDRAYPADFLAVLKVVLDRIDSRLGTVWGRDP